MLAFCTASVLANSNSDILLDTQVHCYVESPEEQQEGAGEADDDLYLSEAWPDLGGRLQSAHYRRARYQSYQGNNIINQQRGVSCRSFHVFITRILQSWKVLY